MEAVRRYLDEHLNRSMSPRTTVAIISIISMIASYADVFTGEDTEGVCRECSTRRRSKLMMLRDNVCYLRNMLLTMFQAANVFLLLGCVVENSTLMQLYIWYTLSFVVFGFMVTIIEFLSRIKCEQIWNFIALLADVLYLFVIFWCLPIIDSYRKTLGSGALACRASQDVI